MRKKERKNEREKEEMLSPKPQDECQLIPQMTAVFNTLMNLADKKKTCRKITPGVLAEPKPWHRL